MSGVRDKDGVVHLAMTPGQLPIVLAHCDAIGANYTRQSWRFEDIVEDMISCVHCLADVRQSLGLDELSAESAEVLSRMDDALRDFDTWKQKRKP